jgi:hypothetical protein
MTRFIKKIILFVLLLPTATHATNFGLDVAGDGMFQGSLPQVISKIINMILSVLGMIFVILIIRGGITWMTSVGNADKIKEAKEVMVNATIGLVIVIASYAIVRFVFDGLLSEGVIGGGGGGVPGGTE